MRRAGAFLLVVLGIWAGIRVYYHHPLTPVAVRTAVGEASPPLPSDVDAPFDTRSPPGTKIPDRLPEFSLADRSGKATSIATWTGRSLMLNFWATWCAPCRREIPLLEALHGEWSSKGVEVVGVAVDHRDRVLAYANELKIPYPLLIGEEDALNVVSAFGVDSPVFPFTVFTDAAGNVVTLFIGELHRPQADLILHVVEQVNQHKLPLIDARRTIADGLHTLAVASPG